MKTKIGIFAQLNIYIDGQFQQGNTQYGSAICENSHKPVAFADFRPTDPRCLRSK